VRTLLLFGVIASLAACTQQEAKQDADAVNQQLAEDANYVASETKDNAGLVGDNVSKQTSRVADNVRDSVKKTNRKVRDWWLTPLPPEPENKPVASSYCYRVLQDILCYRQAMPGWEHRLAGYQGTGAEPPAPAMMRPLPQTTIDPRKTADNRIANSKPIFVNLPPEEKKKENNEEKLDVDPANENLPNPIFSPQL